MVQAVMDKVWRVLMLEDMPSDAELAEHELRKAGIYFISKRVDTREAFLQALEDFRPDIILSDYKLPNFDGLDALEIVQRDHPEVPVIMVTGAFSDVGAADLLAAGAKDYILKDRLARLAPAVQRALAAEQVAHARKVAEQALCKSEFKFRSLVENSSDWIWEVDEDIVYTYVSPRVYDLLGYSAEELIDKKTPFDLMPPDEAVRLKTIFDAAVAESKPLRLLENANLHKDGRVVFLETSGMPFFDNQGICRGYRGINRDITERKQSQVRIQKLTRIYATLSHTNTTIVHARNRDELFREVCEGAVKYGKFAMAWIGLVDEATHRVNPYLYYGGDGAFLKDIVISIDDGDPQGNCPTGMAVRENRVICVDDFATDERMLTWREAALQRGFHGVAGLPLRFMDRVIGTLSLYSDEPHYFDSDQLELLEEMSFDISFALDNFERKLQRQQAEEDRTEALVKLKKSLYGSIQMAANITEMRDPYTAGHQRRVAKLATAIAREIGLGEDQIDGVHFGSLIHDVGKIAIPAEILSKPGRLNEIEFMLIKTHPRAGYDILKDIDFPWPVAQMILQHHERQDGSGYPSGLKGDEIILEAKILVVADVVEAMSSHRPYRPGLGIAAALEEIERGRGKYFDSRIVDVCIQLFRDKQFDFSDN